MTPHCGEDVKMRKPGVSNVCVSLLLVSVSTASDDELCGRPWMRPCDDGCTQGTVWYSPSGLCAPCGSQNQLCCRPDGAAGRGACSDGRDLECRIAPDPLSGVAADEGWPYGLAWICGTTEPTNTEGSDAREEGEDSGEVIDQSGRAVANSRSCPTSWQQCGGRRFVGRKGCCAPRHKCVMKNAYYSQCEPFYRPTAKPPPGPGPAAAPRKTPPRRVPVAKRAAGTSRRVHKSTGMVQWRDSLPPRVPGAPEWRYELDTMLGMSFVFYEIQRAGPLPPDTRVPWRGDSLKGRSGGFLDGAFRGGYYDAGDHLKFQLPGAYAVARLAWLTQRNAESLRRTYFDGRSNYVWARKATKWGADFMAKATTTGKMLLHVGNIKADHGYVGRAEDYPKDIARDPIFCASGACSDVAGEVAASLAHAAAAFQDRPKVRDRYWRKAVQAYAQTGVKSMQFGNSNDVFPLLKTYYKSTGVVSHALFGAASMFDACKKIGCGDSKRYLDDVMKLAAMTEADGGSKFYWEVAGWDNAWWDAAVIMAAHGIRGPLLHGEPVFTSSLQRFVSKWVDGKSPVSISPRGQRWVSAWGSNRYAMGGAAVLLLWSNLPENMRTGSITAQEARCVAVKQIHYVAGDNDRGSFVAGFGRNAPRRNHHRNSSCAPWEQKRLGGRCDAVFMDVRNPAGRCPSSKLDDPERGVCKSSATRSNRFQTHGALIGGPKTPTDSGDQNRAAYSNRGWNDWRTDWIGSEQALDYNAPYTVALASAIELPRSFWTSKCPQTARVSSTDKAGLSRRTKKYPVNQTWSWNTFAAHGWTRTLPANWFARV